MNINPNFNKDPQAEKDYTIDWSSWLVSDTIVTSSWIVPEQLQSEKAAANTTTTATVWLAGGTEGSKYVVTNRIVTAAGRTDERSIFIRIVNL